MHGSHMARWSDSMTTEILQKAIASRRQIRVVVRSVYASGENELIAGSELKSNQGETASDVLLQATKRQYYIVKAIRIAVKKLTARSSGT